MRNGLPNPVYWLLVVLFVVTAASLRLTASCFALMALTSGGPFGHYGRTDRYGSPLELFFRVVFGFSGAMAVIRVLPSLG